MRLLHVSDLHFNRIWFRWLTQRAKEVDAVCLSGDWIHRAQPLPLSVRNQACWCQDWLAAYPGLLFGCTGNHDWWRMKTPPHSDARGGKPERRDLNAEGGWLYKARRPGILLDEAGAIGGLSFYAQSWGGALDIYPSGPTVILANEPPHGHPVAQGEGRDSGDVDLMELAGRLPIGSLVLSGHIHQPRRWCSRCGDAWCFNPGVDRAASEPNHIMIDTERQEARAFLWGRELVQSLAG